jgi:hypothetical protein
MLETTHRVCTLHTYCNVCSRGKQFRFPENLNVSPDEVEGTDIKCFVI